MRWTLMFLWLSFSSLPLFAQQWSVISSDIRRATVSDQDPAGVWYQLSGFPEGLKEGDIIQLPGEKGVLWPVHVYDSPIFSSGLQSQFPDIHAYRLVSDHISGRIAVSPAGIDVVYQTKNRRYYIERQQDDIYQWYPAGGMDDSGGDEERISLGECLTTADPGMLPFPAASKAIRSADLVEQHVYKLAISATSSFSKKNGGTIDLVLGRINEIFNRVNEVFLREMAVRFQIIDESVSLIFLDEKFDPYTEGNNTLLLNKLDELLVGNIGRKNFDVGHLLATDCGPGTAGVSAGIGTICGFDKGKALSCDLTGNLASYVRVLTHELGHQLGASHTWSNCPPTNKNQRTAATAYEPGSGSSIMSYIGTCGDQNLTNISGPLYFHTGSIIEMENFILNGPGGSCVTSTPVSNHKPVITSTGISSRNLYIPVETPFLLEGQAKDIDGDPLTYTWDQLDIGPISPLGSPIQSGPSIRSFAPSESAVRYIPGLPVLTADGASREEVLPAYDRSFSFGFTVRDNFPEGGGVAHEVVGFKSTTKAGPFYIDYPNERADKLYAGTLTKVRWNVAGTNKAPVDVSAVTIRMSADGGESFPFVLAEETDNNGLAVVQLPNVVSDSVRLMVRGYEHMFFDISDENISIVNPAAPTFGLNINPGKQILCLPGVAEVQVGAFPVLDFDGEISYSVDNPYPGVVIELPDSVLSVYDSLTMRISVAPDQRSDTLRLGLVAASPETDTIRREIMVIVVNNNHDELKLLSPAKNELNTGVLPAFKWEPSSNARYYTLEVSESAGFEAADIVFSEPNISADSFPAPEVLEEGKVYFWRVIPHNLCAGSVDAAPVSAFQTLKKDCRLYQPDDLPASLGGSSTGEIRSVIYVKDEFDLSDINVLSIKGFHESVNQIKFILERDTGRVIMYEGECGIRSLNFDLSYDDESPQFTDCRMGAGTTVKPLQPLADLKPFGSRGDWTFVWKDSVVGAGGVFNGWELELCGSLAADQLDIRADTLFAPPLGEVIFSVVEAGKSDLQDLIFELFEEPHAGQLLIEGRPVSPGHKWTGVDMAKENIRYVNKEEVGKDSFLISIVDREGKWSGLVRVPVRIDAMVPVRKWEGGLTFEVYPNPIRDVLEIHMKGNGGEEGSLSVYHGSGPMMFFGKWHSGQSFLQVRADQWPAGVYFVTFKSRSGILTKKVVKL